MHLPAIVLAGCTIAQPIIPPKPAVPKITDFGKAGAADAAATGALSILGTTGIVDDEAADMVY